MNPARGTAIVLLALSLPDGAAAAEPEPTPPPRGARLTLALRLPMAIATQRLADPRCAAVLDHFKDRDGAPLTAVLMPRSRTPAEHLQGLTFVAESSGPCRRGPVMAWTTPGASRVVICIEHFERIARHNPRIAATVLIHEMLHTLGLPERPPSSESITSGVVERCGR
jgi:hypothetical protein